MNNNTLIYSAIAVAVLAIVISAFSSFKAPTLGGAPQGLAATVATTSQFTVSTTASLVQATSSCTARIISTTASPIMLGFSDLTGFVPSGISGHLQAASTTVAYDSGLYGCGSLRVYSFVAGLITVSSVR